MKDREQTETTALTNTDQSVETASQARPALDMEVFLQMREVIRGHYLWEWDEDSKEAQEVITEIPAMLQDDPRYRLVGDVELEDNVFMMTLWLQETDLFSVAAVDVNMLDALQIDLGKGTVLHRELTRNGLEYHLITYGQGRARQFHVNVIGPRMQQIRDLGRLVASKMDTYSA